VKEYVGADEEPIEPFNGKATDDIVVNVFVDPPSLKLILVPSNQISPLEGDALVEVDKLSLILGLILVDEKSRILVPPVDTLSTDALDIYKP
jgi:hypothetical protein